MPNPIKLYFTLFFISIYCLSFSQLSKGDKYFDIGDYPKAIKFYKKETTKQDTTNRQSAYIKMGNSYKALNDYINAEECLKNAVGEGTDVSPEVYYNYAQILKVNSKYDEAAKYLAKYIQVAPHDENARKALRFCNEVNYYRTQPVEYEIKNIESINSDKAEFSPFVIENKLMFVAERESFDFVNYEVSNTDGQPFIQMYVSQLEGLDVRKSKTLSKSINSDYHDGPASMSPDGHTLYFTRVSNKVKKGFVNHSKIYSAAGSGRSWKNIKGLPINSDQYSVAHPCVSLDNTTMYFTSTMPGGYGGKDIWLIKRDTANNAAWSEPVNLGPDINTSGDEMFPTIRKDGILYFSSNGLPGYGGLDIYSAHTVDKKWILLRNEGLQLNSNLDDFGPTFLNDSVGYFSSNRLGGKGKDDIYLFKFSKKYLTVNGTILLTANSKEFAKNKKVLLTEEDGKVIDSTQTDERGYFEFKNLRGDKKYVAVLDDPSNTEKARYYLAQNDSVIKRVSYKLPSGKFAFKNLPADPNSIPLLSTEEDLVFRGTLKTSGDKKPLNNVKLKILDKHGDVIEETTTDANGNFSFKNIPADMDYIVSIDDGDLHLAEGTKIVLANKAGKEVKSFYKVKEGFTFRVLSSEKDLMTLEEEELMNFVGGLRSGDNANEAIKNAKVKIVNQAGQVIGEAVTDENGNFTFKNIPADENFIVMLDETDANLPEGTKISLMNKSGKSVKSFVKSKESFAFKMLASDKAVLNELNIDEDVSFAGSLRTGSKDGEVLKNVKVKILNKKGEVIGETTTNEFGAFAFRNIPADEDFVVAIDETDVNLPEGAKITMTNRAGKDVKSFVKSKDSFSFKVLTSDKVVLSDMDASDSELMMGIYGFVYDQDKKPIGNAHIKMKDERIGKEIKLVTSQVGRFSFDKLSASKNYLFEMDETDPAFKDVTKVYIADGKGKIYKTIELQNGKFAFKVLESDKDAMGEFTIEDPWLKLAAQKKREKDILIARQKEKAELAAKEKELLALKEKEGSVKTSTLIPKEEPVIDEPIVEEEPEPDFNDTIIENIYYPYGKFMLDANGQAILDKAFKLLTDYPKTILEINSHTDAQSSSGFNMQLSFKRAKAAVDYLISKGIKTSRLKSRGYGETRILNHCTEGTKCSDEDHRVNRRTEFKIKNAPIPKPKKK